MAEQTVIKAKRIRPTMRITESIWGTLQNNFEIQYIACPAPLKKKYTKLYEQVRQLTKEECEWARNM